MPREETEAKEDSADDVLLIPEGTVEGFSNWGRVGKEDRMEKCKMCSSNWKVESSGRSPKGSGGIEDTNLQNRKEGSLCYPGRKVDTR